MDFKKPVIAYTAATNVEAHMIVEMLSSNGIPAHAVEDQSGVSLWAAGTISQFHKPNVWVEESTLEDAAKLIQEFEDTQQQRQNPTEGKDEISGDDKLPVECEECGKTTTFPGTLNGTTQECSHCHAYVDVGELPWEDDWGEPEEEPA